MAISVRASGTWAVATTQSPSYSIPAGYQAGDLGILVSVWRPYTVTATIDQSWTEIIDLAAGSTANGNGTGSSRLFVAYKELGSSETNPTVTRSGTITPAGGVIIVLQKGASEAWDVAAISAAVEQAMGTTAMSHVATTTEAIASGDWIFALTGVADESATFTRATTAISGGPTWSGNIVEYPSTHASSTTGNDMAADLIYRVASSAVASGQSITITATLSAAESVGSVLFRVRVVADTALAGTADGSSSAVAKLSPASEYADAVLADNPLAYWRIGELTGTTLNDSTVNGHNVTKTSAVTLGATGALDGDADTAASGDGTSAFATVPSGVSPWSGDFTVEAWAKADNTSGYQGVFGGGTYLTNGFRLGRRGARWAFWTDENGGAIVITDGTDLTTGTWYHLAVTRSGSTFTLYVNGQSVGTSTSSYVAPSGSIYIGAYSGGDWAGDLDEVAVYGDDLTGTRVDAHYDAASGAADTSLAGAAGGTSSGSAALTTAIKLAGAADGSSTGAAVLTTAIRLAGAADGASAGVAVLSTGIRLAATASGASSGSASLATAIRLAGTAEGSSAGAGILTAPVLLVGAADGGSTGAASLTTAIRLAATGTGTSAGAADLSTAIALAGTSGGASTGAGLLTDGADTSLSGVADGGSSAAVALTTAITLPAVAEGLSSAAALLTTTIALAGVATGSSTGTGALIDAGDASLAAAADGSSAAQGVLATAIALAGTATGTSTGAAALTMPINLVGAATGSAAGLAALATAIALAGSADGSSTGLGALTLAQVVGLGAKPALGYASGAPGPGASLDPLPGRGASAGRPSPGTPSSAAPTVGIPTSTEP